MRRTEMAGVAVSTLEFEEVRPDSPAASGLIAELDADLAIRNPGVDIAGLDIAKFEAAGGMFVIARDSDQAVGCGALLPLAVGLAEIKRVYVPPAFRGRGVSRALLDYLLDAARIRHMKAVRLGTGKGQIEALTLYRSAGFARSRTSAAMSATTTPCAWKNTCEPLGQRNPAGSI